MQGHKLSSLFYRDKALFWICITILAISGIEAWFFMPRGEDPLIVNRYALVLTHYPGASAEKVDSLVSKPILASLLRSADIKKISSNSIYGFSSIGIELSEDVTNVDAVWARLRNYLNDIQLPKGVGQPRLDDTQTYPYTRLIALETTNEDNINNLITQRYVNEIKLQLQNVKGTDKVEIIGNTPTEVVVSLSQNKLANMGLSLKKLAYIIQQSDPHTISSTLENNGHKMRLQVEGEINHLTHLRTLPILSHQGKIIYLQDIADIAFASRKPAKAMAMVQNKKIIVIAVRKMHKAEIANWNQRVDKVMTSFEKSVPSSITFKTLFNQMHYTEARFKLLYTNIGIGFVSVLVVLFFTLGFRAAMVCALNLPLTILFTMICLNILGFSLDQMTVIGLIAALGIMIDNAIVITESIQQQRLNGDTPVTALEKTIQHLAIPLLGASLTTMLTFIPIILLPGSTGEFLSGLAYSLILTLIGSYFISHSLVATLAAKFIKPTNACSFWQRGIDTPALKQLFKRLTLHCLTFSKTYSIVFLLITLVGLLSFKGLTQEFFPPSDRNQITIDVLLSPTSTIERTHKITKDIDAILSQLPEIKSQVWFVGRGAPPFYYNLINRQTNKPSYAQAMVTVNDVSNIKQLVNRIQRKLEKKIVTASITVKELTQGPPYSAPIEFKIYGPSLSRIQLIGEKIRQRLNTIDEVINTRAALQMGIPKVSMTLNEDKALSIGLSNKLLAEKLKYIIDGIYAGEMLDGPMSIPIKLVLQHQQKDDIKDLLSMPLSVITGDNKYSGVPLSTIVDVSYTPEWRGITRRKGRQVNYVYGYLKAGSLAETALEKYKDIIAKDPISLPPGYAIEIGGEREQFNESIVNLLKTLPLVLVLLFTVLFLSFKKSRIIFILVLMIILSISMGAFSLWLSGFPFGFQVIIALIGLVGLALDSSIIIINEFENDEQAKKGDIKALINSVLLTLRHISSTTVTTIAGFVPFILSGGEFWPPFAYVLAGGNLLTTLLVIFWVPPLYKVLLTNK